MKQMIISALLISGPFIVTTMIAFLQFYVIFSKRISQDLFFQIRKKLARIRMILNIIAISGLTILGMSNEAIFCAIIMLHVTLLDIIFYYIEKVSKEKKS